MICNSNGIINNRSQEFLRNFRPLIKNSRIAMAVKEVLSKYSKEQIKKAAQVKALFFDVDGVMTDGGIIYDETGCETKRFNVKDGYIISHLKKAGILVGIIT